MKDSIIEVREYLCIEKDIANAAYEEADDQFEITRETRDDVLRDHLKNIRQLHAKLALECSKALTHIDSRSEKNG